jgi:hypothetical protein
MCHIVMWLQIEQLFRIDGFFPGPHAVRIFPQQYQFSKNLQYCIRNVQSFVEDPHIYPNTLRIGSPDIGAAR